MAESEWGGGEEDTQEQGKAIKRPKANKQENKNQKEKKKIPLLNSNFFSTTSLPPRGEAWTAGLSDSIPNGGHFKSMSE